MISGDLSQHDVLRHDNAVDRCSQDENNTDKGKINQTSWLYQCMIDECSATFERVVDLRMHFVDSHQPGSQFSCYYLLILVK